MKRKEYFSFFLFCLLHWILYRKTWGLGDLRIHYVLNFCFLLFDFYPFLFFLLVLFLHPISLFDMFFIVPPLMCHHGIGFVERRGYGWRCLFCAFFSSSYGSHSNMPIWDRLSLSERYQDLGFCFFFFLSICGPDCFWLCEVKRPLLYQTRSSAWILPSLWYLFKKCLLSISVIHCLLKFYMHSNLAVHGGIYIYIFMCLSWSCLGLIFFVLSCFVSCMHWFHVPNTITTLICFQFTI